MKNINMYFKKILNILPKVAKYCYVNSNVCLNVWKYVILDIQSKLIASIQFLWNNVYNVQTQKFSSWYLNTLLISSRVVILDLQNKRNTVSLNILLAKIYKFSTLWQFYHQC